MTGVLVVGFLLGMTHATEADHIAAVATLAAQSSSLRATVRTGVLWGLGHMTMLVLVGGIVLLVGTAIPEHVAATLESIVGVMLVGLGLDALWRARKALFASDAAGRRVVRIRSRESSVPHTHWHSHPLMLGHAHSHPHSHPDDIAHRHAHDALAAMNSPSRRPRWRPFAVGLVHGVAGSAALVVLAAGAAQEPAAGLAYIVLFGFGSVFGMAFVSLAMALPLHFAARKLPRITAWLGAATGVLSCVIGAMVIASALPEALG